MKILKISFQIDSKKKDNINLYYIFKVLSINLYINFLFFKDCLKILIKLLF